MPELKFKFLWPWMGLQTIILFPVFSYQSFLIAINVWIHSAGGVLDDEHISTKQKKINTIRLLPISRTPYGCFEMGTVHLCRPAPHLKRYLAQPVINFINQLQNSNLILSFASAVRENKGGKFLMTRESSICIKAETSKYSFSFLADDSGN